jgi:hypothetical protein
MKDLYDEALSDLVAVHAERLEWESANHPVVWPRQLPPELGSRWTNAATHVRVLRSVQRDRGGEPPALPEGMSWVDAFYFELRTGDGDQVFYWQRSLEPAFT